MVTGPVIVGNAEVRLMVREKKRGGFRSNPMTSDVLALALASRIACRSVLAPLSASEVTVKVVNSLRTSRRSITHPALVRTGGQFFSCCMLSSCRLAEMKPQHRPSTGNVEPKYENT